MPYPSYRQVLCSLGTVIAFAFAAPAAQAATEAQLRDALSEGADYLDSKQIATGQISGFGGFQAPSALAAAGRNSADVKLGANPSLQDFFFNTLSAPAFTEPTSPAQNGNATYSVNQIEQAILNGYSAGLDPARVAADSNAVAQLAALYVNGSYGNDQTLFNFDVFGLLALNRVGSPQFLRDRTVAVIRANQHNDGGYGFTQAVTPADQGDPSGVDETGSTLAALCEAGVPARDPAVRRGVDFLRSRFVMSSGAFDPGFPPNADSNALAINGLNACEIDPQGSSFRGTGGVTPVDFLLSLQVNDASAQDGAFKSNNGGGQFDGPNVFSTQDALRALGREALSAAPPTRTNPSDPRTRSLPTVGEGTTVPLALAVDDGSGGVTFCRVSVPSGTSLAGLLATANGSSAPGGCATGAEFTGGQLSKLNGQTGTWALSIDRGGEQIAASQAVRFGDFVALRRTSGATPAVPSGAPAGTSTTPVPAATQARTTPAGVASRSLKASRKKRVATVSLSCAKANRLCQGTVYLVYKRRTLARRNFLLGGGRTTKLNVKLSKSAIKRVGKSKRIKINVFSRDGNGIGSTSTRTVTLRVGK